MCVCEVHTMAEEQLQVDQPPKSRRRSVGAVLKEAFFGDSDDEEIEIERGTKTKRSRWSMEGEVHKALRIMQRAMTDSDKAIPQEILANCCGVAFITYIKVGLLITGIAGSGVVMGRLKNGGF